MAWLRLSLVLLIPAAYAGGAVLVGTLLAGKTQGPPMTPPQKARHEQIQTFNAKYWVGARYSAKDHLDLLDAGPAEMKFLTRHELHSVLAKPTCVDTRISYASPAGDPEMVLDERCARSQQEMEAEIQPDVEEIDKDHPTAYVAAGRCRPFSMYARMDRSETSFRFHNVDVCLEGAARAIKWKGYYDLKAACLQEAESVSPQYPNTPIENLRRECTTQNVARWVLMERDRCGARRIFSTSACR